MHTAEAGIALSSVGIIGVYLLCAGLLAAGLALAILFRSHVRVVT